jgi:tRNA-modifying protein YgfZ
VTSDVTGELPVWAGLLTAQGKCLFDFLVWADGDDLLLDCEAQAADDLARRLAIYRLRRKIEIARDPSLPFTGPGMAMKARPTRVLPSLVGVGWRPPESPRPAGSSTGLGWGCAKAGPNSATSCGWSAMRPSSTE